MEAMIFYRAKYDGSTNCEPEDAYFNTTVCA